MLEVGSVAPDFTLRDQNREEVTLSSFRGTRAVLLVFYPLAFTSTCTGELCTVRDDLACTRTTGSRSSRSASTRRYTHKIFAEREGYDFPLLSDFWPHGARRPGLRRVQRPRPASPTGAPS